MTAIASANHTWPAVFELTANGSGIDLTSSKCERRLTGDATGGTTLNSLTMDTGTYLLASLDNGKQTVGSLTAVFSIKPATGASRDAFRTSIDQLVVSVRVHNGYHPSDTRYVEATQETTVSIDWTDEPLSGGEITHYSSANDTYSIAGMNGPYCVPASTVFSQTVDGTPVTITLDKFGFGQKFKDTTLGATWTPPGGYTTPAGTELIGSAAPYTLRRHQPVDMAAAFV